MSRYTAFLYHFGISLAIFAVLGYLIVVHWYPGFFFETDGGWQGIRIIALVDLVLGPLLTLVVFKAGKPGLKFDLSAIAAFQALCLIGGIYVVYSERPLAIVYTNGFFHSMSADDYRSARQSIPDLRMFDSAGVPWITVALPEDLDRQIFIRRRALSENRPLSTLAEYYRPFHKDDVDPETDAYPLELILEREPGIVEQFVSRNGGVLADYVFLPFGTRYSWVLLGIRPADGHIAPLMLPALTEPEADLSGNPGPV